MKNIRIWQTIYVSIRRRSPWKVRIGHSKHLPMYFLEFFSIIDKFRMDYLAAVKENEARAAAEEKRLKAEMAKIAAAKAKEERDARRRAKEDKTKKDDIDDTKENVMEDLLSALQSSGPATVSHIFSHMLIASKRKGKTNQRNQILIRITSSETLSQLLVIFILVARFCCKFDTADKILSSAGSNLITSFTR